MPNGLAASCTSTGPTSHPESMHHAYLDHYDLYGSAISKDECPGLRHTTGELCTCVHGAQVTSKFKLFHMFTLTISGHGPRSIMVVIPLAILAVLGAGSLHSALRMALRKIGTPQTCLDRSVPGNACKFTPSDFPN